MMLALGFRPTADIAAAMSDAAREVTRDIRSLPSRPSNAEAATMLLERMPAGTIAVVLADRTEWQAVDTPDGRQWIRLGHVIVLSSAGLAERAVERFTAAQDKTRRREARALRRKKRSRS